jgi:choline dehydrogenase-like flavoprotein
MAQLSVSEQWTMLRIAEAATPRGEYVPMPDGHTVDAVDTILDALPASVSSGWRGLLHALDLAAVPIAGSRLSNLGLEERGAALERLNGSEATYWLVRAVTAPIKLAQAQTRSLEDAFGVLDGQRLPVARERYRWEERVTDANALTNDEELEVDCVIVGTGAGGAPLARALANAGHAVVMIEEGSYFTRADFHGRPIDRQILMYRDKGMTATLGNTLIPLPLGNTVGGTTTVNSGTCYRTPPDVMRRWQLEHGLHDLGPGTLDPYFEKVEKTLEIELARPEVLGGVARIIARGCDALGYAHSPLHRNAPGCDGQAVCCFGCPTDAKRSTNVSYVPQALTQGAMLFCNARVTKVIMEGGRAVGVVAKAREGNGHARTITVRAKAVALACGAIHTPALLLEQGLANSSDQVGRQLTIHPCGYAWAAFDEEVRGFAEVPQGYAVEEFADQGIRFEGGFMPLELAGATYVQVGKRWTEFVERYDRMACFGFMLSEISRGRVTLGRSGKPSMRYWLAPEDVKRMVRAQSILARIYFAAGAKAVYPGIQSFDYLESEADVRRLEVEGPETVRAHHLDLSAYHPLGTCRMGGDARRAVIGPTNETWDVPGLFVVDGSAVPGPLGVNPQVTIMAISERAAQFVERRIEAGSRPVRVQTNGSAVRFDETMSGMCSLEASEGGGTVDVAFTVRALGEASIASALKKRGASLWNLDGKMTIDGVANERPCEGTLTMRPLSRKATLIYDLVFEDDRGMKCTLHGEKHTGWLNPLKGMTTLYTELRREGALLGRGVLRFDLADLKPWLSSFTRV